MVKTYVFDGFVTFGKGRLLGLQDILKVKDPMFPKEDYFTPLLSVKIKPSYIQGLFFIEVLEESTLKGALRQLQYALSFYQIDFFPSRKYICLTGNGKKSTRTIKDFNKYLVARSFTDENYA